MRITKQKAEIPMIGISLADFNPLMQGHIKVSDNLFKLFTKSKQNTDGGIFTDEAGHDYWLCVDDFGSDYQLVKLTDDGNGSKSSIDVYICAVTHITAENTTHQNLGDIACHLNKQFPNIIEVCTEIADERICSSKGKMHYEIIGCQYRTSVCPICELGTYREKYKNYIDS